METTLNKTELAGALAALGKLICRSSPIPAYRAVQVEANNNAFFFRTHNMTEEIEFRMEAEIEEAFKVTVDFDFFRALVRNCRSKNIPFAFKDGKLHIDDVPITPIEAEWPKAEEPQGDNVTTSPLPENFVEILNQAAPQASTDDPRKILKGINLSPDGITATNGKELFNLPYKFNLDELTIPFPLALMATKANGEGNIAAWKNDLFVMFTVSIGQWRWTAKALEGAYPNWKRVMPDTKSLKHFVTFNADRAERLKFFLKSVTDAKPANEIRLYRDAAGFLALREGDGQEFSVPAEFDLDWGDFTVVIKKDILLHLLCKGHTKIEFGDALYPFIGTGGIGQYIAMPMRVPKTEQSEQQEQQAATQQIQDNTPQPTTNTTTSNQEKSTMIDTNTITHTVSAAMQTSAQNNKPESKLNPMDELTFSVETFKAKLKDMFEEATALSRKTREVSIAQKQKEREYAQTKKTIEKIRVASGF